MTAKESTTRVVADSGDDIGPGQRLREAREAAQISLGEVASRMRLDPRVLELLENDHYERLHGPTFVRGYLSGYARLLDLPERPILEAYERHDHRPPALVSELGRKPEVHVSDFPVRMVTYVIAGLLVVLVVLWWQSRQLHTATPERAQESMQSTQQSMGPSATDTAAADASAASAGSTASMPAANMASAGTSTLPMPGTAPVATQDLQPETSSASPQTPTARADGEIAKIETTPVEVRPAQQVDSQSQHGAPSATPPAPLIAEATAASGAANADEAATGQTDPQSEPLAAGDISEPAADAGAGENAAGNETANVQAPRPEPLPGSDRLAIQLKRESWVEIYDRGGGRLYYSLAGEGTEVVVEGAGPMRVLLGDVEGAAVAYNGEPFDLSRYRGRSVVRFTVGERTDTPTPGGSPPATPQEPLTRKTPQHLPASQRHDSVADAREALDATPSSASKHVLENRPVARAAGAPQGSTAGGQPDS